MSKKRHQNVQPLAELSMTAPCVIALDVMGGDKAPDLVIEGAAIARIGHPNVSFLLIGPEDRINTLLSRHLALRQVSVIQHTETWIDNNEKPSKALRTGRNSSMGLAITAVAEGRASACVSAGNTGALMAMAKIILRPLDGIDRPAIASYLPTRRGETVMLDLGANTQCDANNLFQFAVLGNAFARVVLSITKPKIGLLNVGSEEMKGHDELRSASQMLRDSRLCDQFVGFIEGDDITSGAVDVVVTDGFTGNVALKSAEGTAKMIAQVLRESIVHSWLAKLGYPFLTLAIKKFRLRVDPRRYNGAVFLGLNGIAVKSHGGTDAVGYANAIKVAIDLVQHEFLNDLRREIDGLIGPKPPSHGESSLAPSDPNLGTEVKAQK
ncbi:MAG: phosphate acyltransferase PlsX [Candidatus Symbiobacter sp.]|nr:phosphate acyltransferase PlsX [Candidatus Symbiobacter sp.]